MNNNESAQSSQGLEGVLDAALQYSQERHQLYFLTRPWCQLPTREKYLIHQELHQT